MTADEWRLCDDPHEMLRFVSDNASDRKLRLVSCAYSRAAWHLLCPIGRDATEIAERYADGEVDDATAVATQKKIQALLPGDGSSAYSMAVWALMWGTRGSSYPPSYGASLAAMNLAEVTGASPAFLASVVRDIVADPFQLRAAPSEWLTGNVVGIANSAYASNDFGALPILADALEEAGCCDTELLEHCRGAGPHFRGCWAVDLLRTERRN